MALLWKDAVGLAGRSAFHVLDHLDPEGAYNHLAAIHGLTKQSAPFHEQAGEVAGYVHDAHARDGFTVHAHRGDAPDSGYVVSESKHSERKIPLEHFTSDHVRQYAQQNRTLLEHPKRFLGCWVDSAEDGSKTAVMDVNRCYESKQDAHQHGQATDQDAIYGVREKEVFPVTKPDAPQAKAAQKYAHLMDSNKVRLANGLPAKPGLPWAGKGDF